MHPDDGFHDHAGTVMVIAWGQFMDHDFTLTGTPLGKLKIYIIYGKGSFSEIRNILLQKL